MSLATSSLMRPSLTRRVAKNPDHFVVVGSLNGKKRNFKNFLGFCDDSVESSRNDRGEDGLLDCRGCG